ncbi:MAG TPA: hypothetical protein VGQ83_26460 [Polyangia bacterium]
MGLRHAVALCLLGVPLGCATAPAAGPAPAAAAAPRSGTAALPRCASRADVERLHGQRVLIEGRYEVEPVPGGKRLQAAAIVLPDRTRLVRAYRPVPEELVYLDRRVIVVGRVFRDAGVGAQEQQVLAPHVRPERIELAPGETPQPVAVPTELPSPPVVRTGPELDAHDDRWVQAFGRLTALKAHDEDPMWANATLALMDGAEVRVRTVVRSRWEPLVGSAVTVVGLAGRAPAGEARGLGGRTALCAGHLPRCDLVRRQAPGP